jgi:hypothetical protein
MKAKACMSLLVLIFLAGCTASLYENAKKVGIMANETYISQYDDYLTFFNEDENGNYTVKPGVSEGQKVALRKRKEILIELDELTDTLNTFLVIGYLPPEQTLPQLEAEILRLIRRLGG